LVGVLVGVAVLLGVLVGAAVLVGMRLSVDVLLGAGVTVGLGRSPSLGVSMGDAAMLVALIAVLVGNPGGVDVPVGVDVGVEVVVFAEAKAPGGVRVAFTIEIIVELGEIVGSGSGLTTSLIAKYANSPTNKNRTRLVARLPSHMGLALRSETSGSCHRLSFALLQRLFCGRMKERSNSYASDCSPAGWLSASINT
jgi:hypothetical protein